MTKRELLEDVRNSYLKFCKGYEQCKTCPYVSNYFDCETSFAVDYIYKIHLKSIEKERANNEE